MAKRKKARKRKKPEMKRGTCRKVKIKGGRILEICRLMNGVVKIKSNKKAR